MYSYYNFYVHVCVRVRMSTRTNLQYSIGAIHKIANAFITMNAAVNSAVSNFDNKGIWRDNLFPSIAVIKLQLMYRVFLK